MKNKALAICVLTLLLGTVRAAPVPYGIWDFNNNLNRSGGAGGSMASGGTVSYVAGVGGSYDTTAIQVAAGKSNYLKCTHGMPANGGGSYVNEYTLMWDVKYPNSGTYKCLLQTNPSNSNDGDFFVRNSNGTLGSQSQMGGYSTSATSPNTWYRVVLVVDSSSGAGGNDVIVYVNGSVWRTKYDISVDSTLTLDPSLFLSEDDNGEDDTLVIGTFACWNSPLSASDVAGLGAVGSSISHPVIAQGDTLSQTVTEDGTWAFTVNASDPNADTLTWSVVSGPAHGTVTGISGTGYSVNASYTPAADYSGTDTFVVRATDTTGLSDSLTVTATVTSLNDAPRFSRGADQAVNTGSGLVTVLGWATGIDDGDPAVAQSLTFIVANDNTALFSTQPALTSGGTLSFTPAPLASGTATVTVTLTDDATAGGPAQTSAPQLFTITVVNTAPTVSAIADRAISEGASTGPISFTVGDAQSAASALTVTAASDNTILVPNANITFGGAGASRTVTVTPAAGQRGTATVTLTVSDGALSTQTTFTLTVTGSGGANDHTLVVTSLHGGASPSVGTNTLAYGVPVLCQVTNSPLESAGVQFVCTGWDLTGGAPAIGAASSFTLVPTNDMQLAWRWGTNYWLELGVSGGGEVSENSGWYAAGGSVTVEATDNAAWRFAGWIGDTGGCSIAGASLTVLMARPRGPVTALFESSDLTLTIGVVPGSCDPVPGIHTYANGASVTCSASDRTEGLTQYVCTGWSLQGAAPHAGSGRMFTAFLKRNASLAWQWQTNHWLDTAVSGNGSVSVADGWKPAGVPVGLVAAPGSGQRFVSWSGDTAGCTVGGNRLVVPMDRPRGPITATFAADAAFTIVALPDSQNYCTSGRHGIYDGQCQWIVDNIASRNIQFVTHLGDIVNTASSSTEWSYAAAAMNILNGQVPYNACRGNHDMGSLYLTHFGPSAARWKNGGVTYDWYKGASPSGNSSYQMITYGGRTFLFLNLDVDGPGSLNDVGTEIGWAQSVINTHRGVLTILSTHDYLAEVGGSGNTGSGTGARGPCVSAYVSGGHSGLWLRENFVLPNNEIFMMICGHNFAQYNLAPINQAGNPVHEILVDYQTLPNGGNGFLRNMSFEPASQRIISTTYSPYLGRDMTRPANSTDSQGMLELTDSQGSAFTINFDFDHRFDGDLAVVSAYGPVTPAVGMHAFAPGMPVLCQAAATDDGQTRRRATGWTLSGSQTGSGSGDRKTVTMNGDAQLVWQWATDYWLATAEVGDGQVSVHSGWQPAGAVVNLQALADPGADFVGWSGDTAGCEAAGATLSVPMNRARGPITAQFTSQTSTPLYTLTVASAENSVSPTPGSYLYTSGAVVTCSAALTTLGGTQTVCTGWALSDGTSGQETSLAVSVAGDRTLTWSWSRRFALQTGAVGPGAVTPQVGWLDEGAIVTLVAQPSDEAVFAGWEGDLEGLLATGPSLTFTLARARGPVTARFAYNTHEVTVHSVHGLASPSGTVSVAHGTLVTNAVADEVSGGWRYVCAGWRLAGHEPSSGTSNCVVYACTNDASLTWLWTTQVLARVAIEGGGLVTPLDASGWHRYGTNLTLQAQPSRWYRFDRWLQDAGGETPGAAFTLNGPLNVTARFVPETTPAGTPVWWLDQNGLATGSLTYAEADASDTDGDGFTAAQERQSGTAPDDPASVLRISGLAPAEGTLSWRSVAGRTYDVLCSTNLVEGFVTLLTDIPGQAGQTTVALPLIDAPQVFWRISVRAPVAVEPPPASTNAVPLASAAVSAGTFVMGDDISALAVEKPAHSVTLSAFTIDRFEVTRAAWRTIAEWANAHGYDLPADPQIDDQVRPDDHPVTPVSWYEAVKWCNARSELEGRTPCYYADAQGASVYRTGTVDLVAANVSWSGDGYRLPTEAEWEYAARGGLANAQYPWGDASPDPRANQWEYWVRELDVYPGEYPWTTPVGLFDGGQTVATAHQPAPDTANGFGLYDMAGNVMEWCWDRRGAYRAQADQDPRGPDSGEERALRGGSWWNEDVNTRCAFRYFYLPAGDPVYGSIGFRCVRCATGSR